VVITPFGSMMATLNGAEIVRLDVAVTLRAMLSLSYWVTLGADGENVSQLPSGLLGLLLPDPPPPQAARVDASTHAAKLPKRNDMKMPLHKMKRIFYQKNYN
jgi:hypothetical protein